MGAGDAGAARLSAMSAAADDSASDPEL